ncbi:hypothetical protein K7G98_22095, partial [Saccharothrix sp. MB29]|nr:hypothetical protein [Saccharothrix sp. MB29]
MLYFMTVNESKRNWRISEFMAALPLSGRSTGICPTGVLAVKHEPVPEYGLWTAVRNSRRMCAMPSAILDLVTLGEAPPGSPAVHLVGGKTLSYGDLAALVGEAERSLR